MPHNVSDVIHFPGTAENIPLFTYQKQFWYSLFQDLYMIYFQTRVFSLVGGNGLKGTISNTMKELITHELSTSMNVTGTKGKTSFLQFRTVSKILFSKFINMKYRLTACAINIAWHIFFELFSMFLLQFSIFNRSISCSNFTHKLPYYFWWNLITLISAIPVFISCTLLVIKKSIVIAQ